MLTKQRKGVAIVGAILVLLGFARTEARGQTDTTFQKVGSCFATAEDKFKSKDQKNLIRFARDDFDSLTQKWTSGGSKVLPDDYMNSVAAYCDFLSEAGQSNKSLPEITKILQFIKQDVKSKLLAASRTSNLTPNMNSSLTVTVRTFKNNTEVSGYIVKCNPDLYGVTQEARFPFASQSSPTSRSLLPGTYMFWIEDSKGNVLKTFPGISIAGGIGENDIKLPVD